MSPDSSARSVGLLAQHVMVVRPRHHHDESRPVRAFAHHRRAHRLCNPALGDPGCRLPESRGHRPGGDRGGFAHQRLLRRRLDHAQPPEQRCSVDDLDVFETRAQRVEFELGHAQALLVPELHAKTSPVEPEIVQAVEQRIDPAAGLRVGTNVAHRTGALHLRGKKRVPDQDRLAASAHELEERTDKQRPGRVVAIAGEVVDVALGGEQHAVEPGAARNRGEALDAGTILVGRDGHHGTPQIVLTGWMPAKAEVRKFGSGLAGPGGTRRRQRRGLRPRPPGRQVLGRTGNLRICRSPSCHGIRYDASRSGTLPACEVNPYGAGRSSSV